MLSSRKLALRKETLTELSGPEMSGVAGAALPASTLPCLIYVEAPPTLNSCVTCVDTLTIATCQCPTGASCPCPTGAGCV